MALRKETSFKGATADYWRINTFTYNDVDDTAAVHLWLYASEEAKDENLKDNGLKRLVLPLVGIKSIQISEELQQITNPRDLLKTMLYQKIKEAKLDADENETNWFVDAENC